MKCSICKKITDTDECIFLVLNAETSMCPMICSVCDKQIDNLESEDSPIKNIAYNYFKNLKSEIIDEEIKSYINEKLKIMLFKINKNF